MILNKNISPRQERYLANLAAAKERLFRAISGLTQHTLTTEWVVGDWTVKDMLGHLVSWNEEFRREIQLILEDRHPGYELIISGVDDFSAWNKHWIEQKRDLSWLQILKDVERDFEQAAQLIVALTPQEYRRRGVTPWQQAALTHPRIPSREDTDSVDTLVTFHWRHTNQHTRMIERWRKRRKR